MAEKKLREADASEYLGGAGNIGHLWAFIDYFEKKLDAEIAPYQDWIYSAYATCPNFAAWIRLYAELICNKAMVELNRAEKCKCEIRSYRYSPVIEEVIRIAEKGKITNNVDSVTFERRTKAIKLVVELRHTLQHGSIPNILRKIEFEEVCEEEVRKMITPQNYLETKNIFQDANKLIEMLPRPTITVYQNGRTEFTDFKTHAREDKLKKAIMDRSKENGDDKKI